MLSRPLHQRIARLMLVWFALVLGTATASPFVQPRALQLVCSTAGAVLIDAGDGSVQSGQSHTLDCALCLLTNTPTQTTAIPMAPGIQPEAPHSIRLPEPILAWHGAPLPARGPPALS